MKSMIRHVDDHGKKYDCLAFVCPGCIEMVGGTGLHMLCVNSDIQTPSWHWDGNLLLPTLEPSILTKTHNGGICHSFIHVGVFEYLNDCTHSLAGQKIAMPDLPEWFIKEIR